MISKNWKNYFVVIAVLTSSISFSHFAEAASDKTNACINWALLQIPEADRPAQGHLNDFLYKYQQTTPLAHDPIGDYVLLALNEQTFARIYKALVYKNADHGLAPDQIRQIYDVDAPVVTPNSTTSLSENEIKALPLHESEKERMLVDLANSQMRIEGRINPIRSREMINALAEVIREEAAAGLSPKLGAIREWSPEIKEHCPNYSAMLKFSKILETMARGDSSRFMITGQEKGLEDYMMGQTENSVTPDQLFRASYRLNQGDVQETLLTIENVLSRNWRNPKREDLVLTHRLAPMANFYEHRGTNFGVWYHFFGVVYYGYAYGAMDAFVTGVIEHTGSLMLGEFAPQMQKGAVNTTGGFVGAGLRKMLMNGQAASGPRHPEYLNTDYYLNLTEDFRDRIEVWSNPDYQLVMGDQKIELTSTKEDLKDCRLELVTDEGHGFAEGREVIWEGMNFKKGKATMVLMPYPSLKGVRAFIDGCVK